MRAQINTRDYEQISAYIDGQLSQAEQRKLEERLRRQPELQEALDDLTRTRALLRQAPRRRAPRNFTLTPAMVGDFKPRAARRTGWNLFPALSFASALAALALVASLLFQSWPGAQPVTTAMTQPEVRQAAPAEEPALAQEAPAAAGEAGSAPPVINWGGSGAPMAKEGLGGYGGGDGSSFSSGNEGIFTAPGCPDGRCGGAPDTVYGMGGDPSMGTGLGGGGGSGITLPPQSVEPQAGIMAAPETDQQPAPTPTPALMGTPAPAAEAAPAQPIPESTITGSGPILGVPAPDKGGEIYEKLALRGLPDDAAAMDQYAGQSQAEPRVLGLPRLVFIQVLLGLIALVTGAAAFVLWRRSRQPGR